MNLIDSRREAVRYQKKRLAKGKSLFLVPREGFEPSTPCLKGSNSANPETRMNKGFAGIANQNLQQICNSMAENRSILFHINTHNYSLPQRQLLRYDD